jgi:hypothetical protein
MYYSTQQKAEQAGQLAQQNQAALVRELFAACSDPLDAKVEIVEFLDPACGTCQRFYPLRQGDARGEPEAHPPGVALRAVPRERRLRRGADRSREDGRTKYWETLEALLASQDDWIVRITSYSQNAGLAAGRAPGAGHGATRSGHESAGNSPPDRPGYGGCRTLEVSKTPEFFVNGKPLPSFGYEQLQALVQEELASAYR